jgi:uncharacterized OB-fold protein
VVEESVETGTTGTIVAYTAPFDRERGPQAAIGLVDMDGRRTVARADDALTTELLGHDGIGTHVVLGTSDKGNTMRGA